MTLSCPACGKKYEGQSDVHAVNAAAEIGPVTCQRCGSDLSQLLAALRAAAMLVRMAKASFERGDWDTGLAYAARSWSVAHDTASAHAGCLAAAALGDSAELEQWRRRAAEMANSAA
ncbi:MAG: hypothetical protein ABI442_16970 [Gemmatimonadaceae bacterium]